jgi:hypothetical protein
VFNRIAYRDRKLSVSLCVFVRRFNVLQIIVKVEEAKTGKADATKASERAKRSAPSRCPFW